MGTLFQNFSSALGLGAEANTLTFWQISVRGIIVFVAALAMIRLGDKRFLSNKSAFDVVLSFILASMLARAVNGTAAFFPTLGGGFVIIGLHRFLAYAARSHHGFGLLVKGKPELVIRDGTVKREAMRRNNLSDHDLHEDLRLNGNVDDPSQVKAAYFERNGQITVVRKQQSKGH